MRTRRAPKVLDNDVYIGKVANVKERRGDVELEAMVRQQHTNFFMSESAQTLRERKSRLPAAERKSIRQRLTRAPSHLAPRTKSPTNLGHLMRNGDHSVNSPDRPDAVSPKATPKSKAKISPISSRRQPALRFQGLSTTEFFHEEWTPSLKYRPAQQVEPWQPLDGFSQSTRTLERRKLDPFTDINSYTGNYASAKAQYNSRERTRRDASPSAARTHRVHRHTPTCSLAESLAHAHAHAHMHVSCTHMHMHVLTVLRMWHMPGTTEGCVCVCAKHDRSFLCTEWD